MLSSGVVGKRNRGHLIRLLRQLAHPVMHNQLDSQSREGGAMAERLV